MFLSESQIISAFTVDIFPTQAITWQWHDWQNCFAIILYLGVVSDFKAKVIPNGRLSVLSWQKDGTTIRHGYHTTTRLLTVEHMLSTIPVYRYFGILMVNAELSLLLYMSEIVRNLHVCASCDRQTPQATPFPTSYAVNRVFVLTDPLSWVGPTYWVSVREPSSLRIDSDSSVRSSVSGPHTRTREV